MEVEIHPNIPELYRRKVGKRQALLVDETTRPQAMDVVRSLIDRVEIHPAEERNRYEAILAGGLAQILAFTHDKRSGVGPRGGGTILMVAGARNHLYRTRFHWPRRQK